jgi:hypothetical protein
MNTALLGLRIVFLYKSPIQDSSFKVRSQHIPNMPRKSLATDTSTGEGERKNQSIFWLCQSELKQSFVFLKKYKESMDHFD